MPSALRQLKYHALCLRDFFIDLLFPVECIGCGESGTWLCERCQNKMPFNYCQVCPNCHKPTEVGEYCPLCRDAFRLDGVIAIGDYDNKTMKNAIKKLKFSFIRDLAAPLRDYFRDFLGTNEDTVLGNRLDHFLTNKKQIFIPVPLHDRRQRWRGFNQSELLLHQFIKDQHTVRDLTNLKRVKNKKPQSKLTREKRLSNLTDCFQWLGPNLSGKDIILIDDVMTTGSTLDECARVLKKNGARKVWGLVLARGR
jgi:ComF family protein